MIAKRKKSPLELAKDAAWTEFSRFIRTRDCVITSGTLDSGVCVTCKREYPFKKLQAGHFIAGRTNAILLDEDLVHIQCFGCNMGRGGSHVEYFVYMEEVYGRDTIDIFRRRKGVSIKYDKDEWREFAHWYKERTSEITREYNYDRYGMRLLELCSLKKTLKNPTV